MNAGASLTGFSRCENIIASILLNAKRFGLITAKCINLLLLSHLCSFSVFLYSSHSIFCVSCSRSLFPLANSDQDE